MDGHFASAEQPSAVHASLMVDQLIQLDDEREANTTRRRRRSKRAQPHGLVVFLTGVRMDGSGVDKDA